MFRSVIPISSNSIAAPSKRGTIWSRYSRYLAWSRPSLVPPGKNAPIPRDKPLVSCSGAHRQTEQDAGGTGTQPSADQWVAPLARHARYAGNSRPRKLPWLYGRTVDHQEG